MELSQFTDYSLRVLLYLAVKEDGLTSIKDISEAYNISNNHLVKVVHNLAKMELIHTYRGRGGGIKLAKMPEEVIIGQIVRSTENLALLECFLGGKGTCCITGVCILKVELQKALEKFLQELDKLTLADVASNKKALQASLSI